MRSAEHDRPDPADLAALGKTEAEFAAEMADARQRGDDEMPDATAITAARYDRKSGRVVVDLANGTTIMTPTINVQALAKASPDQLAHMEILGSHMLDWPELDEQVYIPDLLKGITGTRAWMAAQLGKKGGTAKTEAKSAAARANGKKGGRPRKSAPQ